MTSSRRSSRTVTSLRSRPLAHRGRDLTRHDGRPTGIGQRAPSAARRRGRRASRPGLGRADRVPVRAASSTRRAGRIHASSVRPPLASGTAEAGVSPRSARARRRWARLIAAMSQTYPGQPRGGQVNELITQDQLSELRLSHQELRAEARELMARLRARSSRCGRHRARLRGDGHGACAGQARKAPTVERGSRHPRRSICTSNSG